MYLNGVCNNSTMGCVSIFVVYYDVWGGDSIIMRGGNGILVCCYYYGFGDDIITIINSMWG